MPRDIPVGNGRLLVCFDNDYAIRDLCFPHVGQENHVMGELCRLGVWIDGHFSWVGADWKRELLYQTDTMVTEVTLYHPELQLLIVCRDAVDFHEDVYLRHLVVENLAAGARQVRLFFSQNFDISGNSVGDTAAFDPASGGIVHYKGPRYLLVNCRTEDRGALDQFAVGHKNMNGMVGTFKDAEDGELSGNTIAQGSVDSVIGLTMEIAGTEKGQAFYWIAVGRQWQDVSRLDGLVKHKGPEALIKRTSDYWHLWVHKESPDLDRLSADVAVLYRRSLLVLNTQIDSQGGIVAANDSDVLLFNRDTYSYIWPRDGALVANSLDVAGYPVIAQRFYEFAARVIEPAGHFLHKFNPDGTLASSWHPWVVAGQEQLPIQEDETALVLWALWNHFVLYRDIEFIKPLYRPLVKRAADFMCEYRDRETGLPADSYDLWEERRGMLSFTTGAVFGGLTAASLFCTVFGEEEPAARYRQAASEIRDAASKHLWNDEEQRFCRMLSREPGKGLTMDSGWDASLWGLFAFGMYSVEDPRIKSTMAGLREALWIKTEIGGMARYEGDPYHRVGSRYPGNPWFICTLWLADYLIDLATTDAELAEARDILEWVAAHALPSGVLAEQVHPENGAPLSVSPLTWSHATFVATTQRMLRKLDRMSRCPECGLVEGEKPLGEDWLSNLYSEACDFIHGICTVK